MSAFERHLQQIANKISINNNDRAVFTKDYDLIRDYILNNMCNVDRVFNWIYKGTSLFGSYSNNVRINSPDEFDVIFKLCFPYSRYIIVEQDPDRPGFVLLDFNEVKDAVNEHNGYEELYECLVNWVDWNSNYLRRSNLQRWLATLIRKVLRQYGKSLRGSEGDVYELKYSKRGLAHTIYASCSRRSISIDFVPAIVFALTDWIDVPESDLFANNCHQWFALPKPAGPPSETRNNSFMICNPIAEHDLLLDKQNLKTVFRLLKSLRNNYEMDRLKSYFFTTAFLWEVEEQDDDFWFQPLEDILIHMLDVLSDYFLDGNLPFFWDPDCNLLDILDDDEIEDYSKTLNFLYNRFITYPKQRKLSYDKCASFFEIE